MKVLVTVKNIDLENGGVRDDSTYSVDAASVHQAFLRAGDEVYRRTMAGEACFDVTVEVLGAG